MEVVRLPSWSWSLEAWYVGEKGEMGEKQGEARGLSGSHNGPLSVWTSLNP